MDKWKIRDRYIDLCGPMKIMGILNITPDSFSDGGDYNTVEGALERARMMIENGASILDIGGESTRPGSDPVSEEEEIRRVVPVIRAIRSESDIPISVDTYREATARAALEAGADIVNDVRGFRKEPKIADVVNEFGAGCVLMSNACGIEHENIRDLRDRCYERSLEIARKAGVKDEQILLDPGVGFGTTRTEDIELMKDLEKFSNILLGVSRKRIVDHLLGGDTKPKERVEGSVGLALAGAVKGVKVIRVHDVKETADALKTFEAVMKGEY